MNRRTFLTSTFAPMLALTLRGAIVQRAPRILLRSSWQVVNIGDIAHTPGVLALIEQHLPHAEVRLWPMNLTPQVEAMLKQRFPALRIVRLPEEVATAFAECDFLLHGSGPGLVAEADVDRWRRETAKPYGVFGITLSRPLPDGRYVYGVPTARTLAVLNGARFAYFRDTPSLKYAQEIGCTCPLMEFGPDGAFACDLRDDQSAKTFLAANGLEAGRFLCCISKLRYTPVWLMHADRPVDEAKHRRNEAMKEHDHAPLRAAITALITQTDFKVLLCPEDTSEMAVEKELIYDRLPEPMRRRVVWRPDYWLTAEALSVYRHSAGLFGHEMHSPIMCIGQGIPALVGRWAEQTTKGFMWRDIGLDEWLIDFDREEDIARLGPAVLSLAKDPAAARAKAARAQAFVAKRQRAMTDSLQREAMSGHRA